MRLLEFSELANPTTKQCRSSASGTQAAWRGGAGATLLNHADCGLKDDSSFNAILEGLPEEKLVAYNWSRDDKQFAFVRDAEIRDVILLRNTH